MTTTTYDPEVIALACLAEQLGLLAEMDSAEIVEAAEDLSLTTPPEEAEEDWDRIVTAIGRLADRVRAEFGIEEEGASSWSTTSSPSRC